MVINNIITKHRLLFLSLLSFLFFIATFAGIIFFNSLQMNQSPYYKISDAQAFNFTTIKLTHEFPTNAFTENPMVAKKKIVTTLKAQNNHLGIIAVPFNTYNKSINDKIIFRIKEQGAKNWYAQNTYDTNQLQTDIPFPFGFPAVSNSRNKSYTFEIESLTGTTDNAIALRNDSFFITEYIFTKSVLLKNPHELLQFLSAKIDEGISHFTFAAYVFLLVSLLAPFVTYFATNKRTKIILNGFLLLMVLHLFSVSFAEVLYPYPREYRDGALIDIASQFIKGVNPYTLSNALPHTYTYGFISSLVDALVSGIFRIDLVLTHHLITFLCVLLLCFIVGKEIFKTTRNISLVFISLIIVLIFNSVSLRPETLAILLTTATLSFVHHNKKLDFKKILLVSLSIISLYYIKQYFIILLPVLCSFFIFNQPKKNLLYLLLSTFVIGGLSFMIINKIFPLYFPQTIISYVNLSGGPSTWVTHQSNYIIKQSIDFFQLNWVLVLIFVAATLMGLVRDMVIKFNVTDMNKPLFTFPDSPLKDVYFFYSCVAIIFLSFLLGYSGGAYLTYYFHLLPIPLCVFGISFLYTKLQKYTLKEHIFVVIVLLFICEYATYLTIPIFDQANQRQAWEKATTYIAKHNPQTVYLSPIFATVAVQKGWPMYDNGQTDFFPVSLLTQSSEQFRLLSPQDQQTASRIKEWQNEIDQKVIHKKFSLIVLPAGHRAIINDKDLVTYYRIKQKMNVPLNFGDLGPSLTPLHWRTIEFWEPK